MQSFVDLKEYSTKIWEGRLGEKWSKVAESTFHGPGWSIAVEKDYGEKNGPKTTTIHAFARKSDGTIVEKTFGPHTSNSWEGNSLALSPEVNAWCIANSGNNPMLA